MRINRHLLACVALFAFALVAGLLVDLNQYLIYPIPAWIVASWFVSGLIEFTLYGVLASRLVPVAARPAH